MTEWILSSSILVLIVITLRVALKGRIRLKLQYALWGLVLLRLVLPFSIGSTAISVANITTQPKPTVAVQTEKPHADIHVQLPQTQPGEMPTNDSLQEGTSSGVSYKPGKEALIAVWAVGFLMVVGIFLVTNLRFKHKIMASRQKLTVQKGNLEVYASDGIDTPCLFGICKPTIYVTGCVATDETLLRHTLAHEATHYRHGDHIWAILRCVCLAIHWYNPLVWWAAFLSRRDGELACDEATIRQLGEEERAEYGRTLISMTCQKRANVLMTATTMTTGKDGIRERILLIAKKPRTAAYALVLVILVAAVAVGCTFTGAKKDGVENETLPPVTEPMPTSGTEAPTQSTTLPIVTEPAQTLPPQESTTQPPVTEPPEVTEPENPLGITEILSATLEWNGVHTVTRPNFLKSIEKWLLYARRIDSAACPFSAQLTLELENGQTRVLQMATDSCAAFLYEGVAYSYAELTEDGYTDNVPFFSLFAPEVIHEKSRNDLDGALGYLHYLNWGAYYSQYGPEETLTLLHKFEAWVAEEPTYERFGCMIECGKGLDGAIAEGYGHALAVLYELAPKEFAWACLGNATDEAEEQTIFFLAFKWEMTKEEARAKLEAQLQQNG